jgi:hypothetical protein
MFDNFISIQFDIFCYESIFVGIQDPSNEVFCEYAYAALVMEHWGDGSCGYPYVASAIKKHVN